MDNKWLVTTGLAVVALILGTYFDVLGLEPDYQPAALSIQKNYKLDQYMRIEVKNISDEIVDVTGVTLSVDGTVVPGQGMEPFNHLMYAFQVMNPDEFEGTALQPGRAIEVGSEPISLIEKTTFSRNSDFTIRCITSWLEVSIAFTGRRSGQAGQAHYLGDRSLDSRTCDIDTVKGRLRTLATEMN